MTWVFRVAIPASRIGRARTFYQRVLAIEADDTVPSRLYFHCGDVIVAVIDWDAEGRAPFRPTPENLYFAAADVEAVRARAVAAGAREVSEIEVRPWGERSFYCLDPDGNRLCFVDETTLFLGRGADWAKMIDRSSRDSAAPARAPGGPPAPARTDRLCRRSGRARPPS